MRGDGAEIESTGANRLGQRIAEFLEVVAIAKRTETVLVEPVPVTDHLGPHGVGENADGPGAAVCRRTALRRLCCTAFSAQRIKNAAVWT